MKRGVAGGVASGKLQRDRALARYYENPNRCLYCGSVIKVGEGQKVNQVKKKKFCDRSHAASYNNSKSPKRSPQKYFCAGCDTEIERERLSSGRLSGGKYCKQCLSAGILRSFGSLTKGDLFADAVYYTAARTRITRHARRVYVDSCGLLQCIVCGYEAHVHICHIRNVSEFSNDVIIDEINSLENLVALCPNHHWEFDNGLLSQEILQSRAIGSSLGS